MEDNYIVNDPILVSNMLNNHFVNAADGTGMPDFIIEHDGVDSITAPHIGKQIVLNNC
jgi:hypothetical protein